MGCDGAGFKFLSSTLLPFIFWSLRVVRKGYPYCTGATQEPRGLRIRKRVLRIWGSPAVRRADKRSVPHMTLSQGASRSRLES